MRIIKKSITIIARDNISDIINTTSVAPYTTDVIAVQPNGDFSSIVPFVIISVALVLVILGSHSWMRLNQKGYGRSTQIVFLSSICEKADRTDIIVIDKQKYLVPSDLTVGQFVHA